MVIVCKKKRFHRPKTDVFLARKTPLPPLRREFSASHGGKEPTISLKMALQFYSTKNILFKIIFF